MAEYFSSLFKKSDVRITQGYNSNNSGLDLSRGVVEQPIYLPNKAISGYVWKILPSYTAHGVYYPNSPIIYIKHKNGSGSRYIHSYPRNVKVKVGDTIVAGQQVCATGNSGHSFGDHLHFEWLTKWDDLNTRVDPTPYVINDNASEFSVGDEIEITEVQNIRKGSGVSFDITKETKVGERYVIEGGFRIADGYTWWDLKNSDWIADVGKFKKYVAPPVPPVEPPVEPPDTPNCDEYIKQVVLLTQEKDALKLSVGALEKKLVDANEQIRVDSSIMKAQEEVKVQDDIKINLLEERSEFLENTMAIRETEYKDLEKELENAIENTKRFEKQYLDAVTELNALKEGRDNWINRLADMLHKLFGR